VLGSVVFFAAEEQRWTAEEGNILVKDWGVKNSEGGFGIPDGSAEEEAVILKH
jgi:hypothetical protein